MIDRAPSLIETLEQMDKAGMYRLRSACRRRGPVLVAGEYPFADEARRWIELAGDPAPTREHVNSIAAFLVQVAALRAGAGYSGLTPVPAR